VYDIYYFSGTGNTKAVGELLKEKLNCDMYSIENEPFVQNDMIVMFPIYGFGTPKIVLEWLRKLPYSNKEVAIVTTGADNILMNKSASNAAIEILEKKGYKVRYDRIVIMASNFLMAYPDAFVKQLYEIAKIKTDHIVYELENKIRRRYNNSLLVQIIKPIHYGESKILSKVFGESLGVNGSCTKCLICVKLCPCDNIEFTDDTIRFSSQCILCMRCVYSCPVKAIESSSVKIAILSKGYNLEGILNKTIDSDYVTSKTKGFYKHFIQYIEDETI